MLANWDMPASVVLSARYHHKPAEAVSERPLVAVVGFADALAHRLGLGDAADDSIELIEHPAVVLLQLSERQVHELSAHVPGLFTTARDALVGNLSPMGPRVGSPGLIGAPP